MALSRWNRRRFNVAFAFSRLIVSSTVFIFHELCDGGNLDSTLLAGFLGTEMVRLIVALLWQSTGKEPNYGTGILGMDIG